MAQGIRKTTLDNGIRVITRKMPHARSVAMGVWVNAGARDEAPQENGLSHLIEHMIFKGTQRRTAYDIAKEFDAIGGHSNAFTSLETTCYHAKVLDTHLPSMVDILSDIFLNSAFDPQEIERERPVILQEIGMVEDSPEECLHMLAGANFWQNHPLGRSVLGTRDNIMGFDAPTIRRFFKRLYQPERIIITAAGHLDHDAFLDLVAPPFVSVRQQDRLPRRVAPQATPGISVHCRQLEQQHLSLICPGVAITDEQRYAFFLLNALVGGNMSSSLFQEIREQRGLAYSVYSYVSSYADSGMFGVYAGVDSRDAETTVALILEQLNRYRDTPVPDDKLRGAKEYTKGGVLLSVESNDNQMVRLAQNEINFGEQVPLEQVIEHIESVTADDIRQLAEKLFQPGQMALTTLGPLDGQHCFHQLMKAH